MRRSIVLATVLAASTAIFGACEPKAEAPNKPVTTAPATPAQFAGYEPEHGAFDLAGDDRFTKDDNVARG